jgi:hypothetical protein
MITRDNIKEMAEYGFRNREDYTECILNKTLYIYTKTLEHYHLNTIILQ